MQTRCIYQSLVCTLLFSAACNANQGDNSSDGINAVSASGDLGPPEFEGKVKRIVTASTGWLGRTRTSTNFYWNMGYPRLDTQPGDVRTMEPVSDVRVQLGYFDDNQREIGTIDFAAPVFINPLDGKSCVVASSEVSMTPNICNPVEERKLNDSTYFDVLVTEQGVPENKIGAFKIHQRVAIAPDFKAWAQVKSDDSGHPFLEVEWRTFSEVAFIGGNDVVSLVFSDSGVASGTVGCFATISKEELDNLVSQQRATRLDGTQKDGMSTVTYRLGTEVVESLLGDRTCARTGHYQVNAVTYQHNAVDMAENRGPEKITFGSEVEYRFNSEIVFPPNDPNDPNTWGPVLWN